MVTLYLQAVAAFHYRARLFGNRIRRQTGTASKNKQDCVADIQGRSGQPSRRTRDQTEPKAIRSALAWYGREKTAKSALRNSLGRSADRAGYLSGQTCRSCSCRGGIS